jgi:DNA-binding transcriptional MerR regulator
MPASSKPGARKSASKRALAGDGSGLEQATSGPGFDLGTDKLYFKIGEVADIVEVAAHVLRYWESEFAIIKPQKSRSQQRVYRRKDVENLLRIKHLLYERKFTIAGARQELRKGTSKIEPAAVSGLYRARQSLGRVREQLDLLAAIIRADPDPAHLAADPAQFIRSVGGAQGLLDADPSDPDRSKPASRLVQRPERD